MSGGQADKEWEKNVGLSLDETDSIQYPLVKIPYSSLNNGTVFKLPPFANVSWSSALLAAWSLESLVLLGSINLSSLYT